MPPSRRPLSALFSVLILAALLVAALPACAPGSASEEAAADTTALKATAIAAGEGYAMALLEDSTVVAWGSGLLPGRDHVRGRPYLPSRVEGLPPICELGSTSGTFALVIACDGTLWSWGSARNRVGNSYGRLGRSVGTRFGGRPAQIAGLRDVVDAAAGNDRALAVTADGTVYSWGQGGYLGRLDADDDSRGYPMPGPVEGIPPARKVAANVGVSFVVTEEGTVWSWGMNSDGDLGRRTEVQRTDPLEFSPDPVPRPNQGMPPIHQMSTSAATLAVTARGNVWSWGYNRHGTLGRNRATVGSDRPNPRPKPIEELPQSIVQASAGSGHSLALTEQGVVWSWGSNCYGHLGRDSISLGTEKPHPNPKPVEGLPPSILQVTASNASASYALSEDGTVYAWGSNYFGHLGREAGFPRHSFDEPKGRPVPRAVPLSEERFVSFESP